MRLLLLSLLASICLGSSGCGSVREDKCLRACQARERCWDFGSADCAPTKCTTIPTDACLDCILEKSQCVDKRLSGCEDVCPSGYY